MNPFQRTIVLLLLTTIFIWGFVGLALAQPPSPECDLPAAGEGNVVNPTRVCFEVSPDHDTLARYDLDIIDPAGTVAQTINMGLPAAVTTGDGRRWVSWDMLNVVPRAFGTGYKSVVRACATAACSPNSADSNFWDRGPLAASDLRILAGLQLHLVPMAD